MEQEPEFTDNQVWHNTWPIKHYQTWTRRAWWSTWHERRVKCSAIVHPRRTRTCRADVQLVEDGERYKDWYGDSQDDDDGDKNSYTYVAESSAHSWCHGIITNRRSEYSEQEQQDIERYWNVAVMQMIKCGRMLADGSIAICLPTELKKEFPEALKSRIPLSSSSSSNGGKAIDGLINSYTDASSSWLSVDLQKSAYVMEIFLLFPEQAFSSGNKIPQLKVETKTSSSASWTLCPELTAQDVAKPSPPEFPYQIPIKCETTEAVKSVKVSVGTGRVRVSDITVLGYYPKEDPKPRCSVDVYDYTNFRKSYYVNEVGTYREDTPQVNNDNTASSVKLQKGCCMWLYKNANYQGGSMRRCTSFSQAPSGWDNQLSSLKLSPVSALQLTQNVKFAVVDGKMATWEEIADALEVDIGTTNIVTTVEVYLKDKYTQVVVSVQGSASGTWTTCNEQVHATQLPSNAPYIANCGSDVASQKVKISKPPSSSDALKIREIKVYGISPPDSE